MANRLSGVLALFCFFFYATDAQEYRVPEYDYIPDAPYELIEDRILCIESDIELNFNEKVKGFIDYFTVRDRPYTVEILNRKDYFFRIFEASLEKYDLPTDLKYLAIVESGLRPNAISRASAVGLWQFMSSTGRMYGLQGDWYIDDRMDPDLATDAAARHLRDLYNMFGDWELALAAYNCGPGNVRKAIRRSGYQKKFWDIYRYLPRETRSYVPQFVAIAYTLNYAEEHNLYPDNYYALPDYEMVEVDDYIHLETLANQMDICVDDILQLNPSIKRGAIPEGRKKFSLKIPADKLDDFTSNRVVYLDSASKVGKAELEYLARNTPGSTYGREKQIYKVRSGDVLGTIARRYGVRVSDIKSWNNLHSNMIRVGQRLNIWVLPSYNSSTKDLYAVSTTSSPSQPALDLAGKKTYQVRPGDTLWDISKSSNVPISRLKELNKLTTNTIKPGQQIILGED
jgi:membrane-bound lytic murein transglycosylase D